MPTLWRHTSYSRPALIDARSIFDALLPSVGLNFSISKSKSGAGSVPSSGTVTPVNSVSCVEVPEMEFFLL